MTERMPGKRLDVLRFLAHGVGSADGPPSISEIAAAVGLRSKQTVYHHLTRLEGDGHIERARNRHRTPRLTEEGWRRLGEAPVLGRVAAGRGLEAVAVGDEAYSIAAELVSGRSGRGRFFLRAVGRSMTGAGIEDGDLLIVEEDESPPDGAVVVALLGGGEEVTVKRLRREGDLVRLRAHNGDHEDIVAPAEEVRVHGRVVHVIHPPRS